MQIKQQKTALKAKKQKNIIRTKLQLVDKIKINHDCYIFNFKWSGPKFHLKIGQHLLVIQHLSTWEYPNGQEIVRKYTPISSCDEQQERIRLMIKIYRPNTNPNFPQGGKLTPYLQKLGVGEKINVEGPYGKFGYRSGGIVVLDGAEYRMKRMLFVAGGSGITPCYQTINEIIRMGLEDIELILLFCNKTQDDIVLRKQLEGLQPRLKLVFLVDQAKGEWKYLTGHVTKQLMESVCPLNDPQTVYVHCGPPPMNAKIRQIFNKYYPSSIIFKY